MTNKPIIVDGVDISGCCQYMPRYMEDYDIDTLDYCKYHFKPCKNVDVKYCYYKQLKRKEQECEELKEERERWKSNFNGKVSAIEELLQQLAQLKEENDKLRKRIVTIFACLIRANRDVIVDTLWVDDITTLWDYIAQTIGIEGDQNQVEEQVEMLYNEGE